jgi:hypothetical protein
VQIWIEAGKKYKRALVNKKMSAQKNINERSKIWQYLRIVKQTLKHFFTNGAAFFANA